MLLRDAGPCGPGEGVTLLIDPTTGLELSRIRQPNARIVQGADFLAVAIGESNPRPIRIIGARDAAVRRALEMPDLYGMEVCYNRVILAGSERVLALAGTGTELWSTPGEYGITDPIIACTSNAVLVATLDGLQALDVHSGRALWPSPVPLMLGQFEDDGERIVVERVEVLEDRVTIRPPMAGSETRIVSLSTGQLIHSFAGHWVDELGPDSWILAAAEGDTRQRIMGTNADGSVRWRSSETFPYDPHDTGPSFVVLGSRIVVRGDRCELAFLDGASGERVGTARLATAWDGHDGNADLCSLTGRPSHAALLAISAGGAAVFLP
jgi:hypothetical protein